VLVLVLVLVLESLESYARTNMETVSLGISDRFGPGTPCEYELDLEYD